MAASIPFIEKLKITGRIAIMGGVLYALGLYVIHLAGGSYSSTPDWWYRILMIIFITWGVWAFRLRVRGYTTMLKSMGAAWLTIIVMTIVMVGGTYVFREYLAPEYSQEAFNRYKIGEYNKSVIAYLNKNERNKLTPEEQEALTTANNETMEKQRYYFSTNGGVTVLLITNTVWGLLISFTVSMLAQPVKNKN